MCFIGERIELNTGEVSFQIYGLYSNLLLVHVKVQAWNFGEWSKNLEILPPNLGEKPRNLDVSPKNYEMLRQNLEVLPENLEETQQNLEE